MDLRLRPYEVRDEAEAVAAHEALRSDDARFLLRWSPTMPWTDFLSIIEDQLHGRNLDDDQVPGTQLVAVVEETIVGRASLRFELNDFFFEKAGHIGFGVLPEHRRKGYATEILRQALIEIRLHGVERVLVTCSDDNTGSYKAIEHNGGVLETIAPPKESGPGLRRYWID